MALSAAGSSGSMPLLSMYAYAFALSLGSQTTWTSDPRGDVEDTCGAFTPSLGLQMAWATRHRVSKSCGCAPARAHFLRYAARRSLRATRFSPSSLSITFSSVRYDLARSSYWALIMY